MRHFGPIVSTVVVVALGWTLVGGCPPGTVQQFIENLDPSEIAALLSDEEVVDALQTLADAVQDEVDVTPLDEAAYFGEDPALYALVDSAAVKVSEDSVADATRLADDDERILGTLAGRFWNDVPDSSSDDSGGVFRGRWFHADGTLGGALRGQYVPLEPEQLPPGIVGGGVFHGKYIDVDGVFRGVLRGRYGHTENGRSLFGGHWLDRHNRLVGVLRGHWTDDPELNGGRFAGRWAQFDVCAEADALPEVEFAADDFGGLEAIDVVLPDVEFDPDDTAVKDEPGTRLGEDSSCVDLDRPHGFVRGWHAPHDEESPTTQGDGWLRGRWRSANWENIGVLMGFYEAVVPEESGQPETARVATDTPPPAVLDGRFFGRYFDDDGAFGGFVRGIYGRGPHGVGVFRARYFDPEGTPLGRLAGRWNTLPESDAGPFFGVWVGPAPEFNEEAK